MTPSLRDVWRAPRLGASIKKMAVAARALVLAWFALGVLGYGAHLVAGRSLEQVWRTTGFFPLPSAFWLGAPAAMMAAVGLAAGALILLVGGTGIAKITYRELKGDDFYGGSDAWRYARRHASSAVGTPLLLAAMAAGGMGGVWLLAQAARMPGAGPLLLGLLSLPALLLALASVWMMFAFLASLLLNPAMAGSTGEDALEGILQTFGLLWMLPGRTAGTLLAAMVNTALVLIMTGLLLTLAVSLAAWAAAGGLGSQWPAFAAGTGAVLPPWCREATAAFLGVTGLPWPATAPGAAAAAPLTAAGSLLTGLALLVIITGVLAYGMSVLVAGITAGWMALRHAKDGENLLEWLDEVDELEERPMAAEAAVSRSRQGGAG